MSTRITIVDYGMGNIRSVHNAFVRLGCEVTTSNRAEDIASAEALVLPGVGAFGEAMHNLEKDGLKDALLAAVDRRKPLLGICLGMQLLGDASEERGHFKGLSLIPGEVRRIPVPTGLRLPHIGWNAVSARKIEPLFTGLRKDGAFYFVHSYQFHCAPECVAATTDYGGDVVAVVQRDHVFGVQFHPERSQSLGRALLKNFVAYVQTRQESQPC